MTTEEKAIELQKNDVCVVWNDGCPNVREAALRMAKWKDKQFEDVKDEIKVDAKKELACEIHKKISGGTTLAELDHYVCGICDFNDKTINYGQN